MSLTLAVALNAVLALGIIATVAFVMSRAARLTPHAQATASFAGAQHEQPVRRAERRTAGRRAGALAAHA